MFQSMRRAVHLFPTLSDPAGVGAVRDRFDRVAAKIPPHVTLVFPFADELPTDALTAHVSAAARGCRAFFLTFGLAEIHDGHVWLPVREGLQEIMALHAALHRGPLSHHRSTHHRFQPHLTLARVRSAQMPQAYQEGRKIGEGLIGRADRIVVERIAEDESCEILAEIPLQPEMDLVGAIEEAGASPSRWTPTGQTANRRKS